MVAYLTKEICFRNRLRKMIVMKRVVGEGIKVRSPNSVEDQIVEVNACTERRQENRTSWAVAVLLNDLTALWLCIEI